ncbi:MAG TPA: YbaB/EbfC family nucleoid-associated protein [Firmicutes bacterium]|nr:YbaB/EbfC family nucleoid-associated protein [Bacillota bacterium]
MGFGPGNMAKMMKQVQKLQADMARIQEELKEKRVEATSGGGMVRVEVTGGLEVKALEIKPEAIDPEDPELLADLVMAAVNEGIRKAQEMSQQEMARITGGLSLPGIF